MYHWFDSGLSCCGMHSQKVQHYLSLVLLCHIMAYIFYRGQVQPIQSKVQHIIKWGLVCQKQVSRAWISNYIPQKLWDVINHACPRHLLLTDKAIIHNIFTYQLWHVFAWKVISICCYPAASMTKISNSNPLSYQHIKPWVFHDDEISLH